MCSNHWPCALAFWYQLYLYSLLSFMWTGEISPLLPSSCRYVPTCSEYSMQAYKKYGVAKGTILTAWRLCRCNPLGGHGYDPPRWFDEEELPKQWQPGEKVGLVCSSEEYNMHLCQLSTKDNCSCKIFSQLPAVRYWRRLYSMLRYSHYGTCLWWKMVGVKIKKMNYLVLKYYEI